MTIYEVLKKDHREVKKLFKEALKVWEEDPQEAWFTFTKIRKELTSHAKAEEEVFYDPLKLASSDHEAEHVSLEGKQEHHVAALLMKELSDLDCKEHDWNAKLTVLSELVDHHVEEEESDIFEKAKVVFSRTQAQEIAEQFTTKKEEYKNKIDEILEKEAEQIHHLHSMVGDDRLIHG